LPLNLSVIIKEVCMTTCDYLTAVIAFIAVCIAFFQLKTNRNILRLGLYNRRFEIYSKLIDLCTELPDLKPFEKMPQEDKENLDKWKSSVKSFTKYYRESKFLFKEDSEIHSILKDISDKLQSIIQAKEEESKLTNEDIERFTVLLNESQEAKNLIEGGMLKKLEAAMKPYLNFHNKYG
jgi:hypothetical protein